MSNREKFEYTKTTRFNKTQIDYIEELENNGLNLRDVLEYYRINNTDERKKLLNREKYLIKHIKELKTELEDSKEELQEVRKKLGKQPLENQETLEIIEAKSLLIERCKSKYGDKFNKDMIDDYLKTKESDRVLAPIISKYGIKNCEEFKKELLNKINLD